MTPPAVSIIIPTYNRASHVRQAIVSLHESGVPGIEIVIADDGSTDDTLAIVREYPHVAYVSQRNAGAAAARNAGFQASSGRYVTFLDSDDEWIGSGIMPLVAQLDAYPDVQLIFGDASTGNPETGFASFVDTFGGDSFARIPGQRRPGGVKVLDRTSLLIQLSTKNVMFLGSLLIRREFFEKVGKFNPALGAEDWEFFMRATTCGTVAYFEGPPLSRYLKHAGGLTADKKRMEREFIRALETVRDECELNPTERTHIEHRVRQQLFGSAYQAFKAGDIPSARDGMRRRRRARRMGPTEWAFMAGIYLPPSVLKLMLRTRHSFIS